MKQDSPSQSFCILPWVHLATNASGQFRLCCNAKPGLNLIRDNSGRPYSAQSRASLKEIWNSDGYRAVRRKMLNGEWPEACSRCQTEEDSGLKSARLAWNESYGGHVTSATENTSADGSAPLNIRYMDLRLGNFCNLKCRMCNPYASKKWLEDWDKVYPALEVSERRRLSNINWFDDPEAWTLLATVLKDCDQIYFTGGEPLLIEEHQRFLRLCIESGSSRYMTLKYNTNMTILTDELVALWREFKMVRLNCSIDGFGELNEYIRHPSKWSTVEKNMVRLDRLADNLSNLILTVHVTVQAYNLLNLTELFDYILGLKNFRKLPYLNILDRPEHLNVRALPRHMQKSALEKIERWMKQNACVLAEADSNYVGKLKGLKEYMKIEAGGAYSFDEFIAFTRKMDFMRSQDLGRLVPELRDFL